MQIFVDADACPVVDIVESIAEKYNIPILYDFENNGTKKYIQRFKDIIDGVELNGN